MQTINHDFNINNLQEIKNLYTILGKIRGKEFKLRKPIIAGEISATIWKYIRELKKANGLESQSKLTIETIDLINRLAFGNTSSSAYEEGLVKEVQLWLHKLGYKIDATERKERQYGESTRIAIKQAQEKYRLKATGELDEAILERLKSAYYAKVHREQPEQAFLKMQDAARLRKVQGPLRLNHKGSRVQALQLGLAWLGYTIHEREYKEETFGKQTRLAVIAYQKKHQLPAFGHVNKEMTRSINRELAVSNPRLLDNTVYRVKGAIREADWKGIKGAKVQIFEKKLRGKAILLAEKETLDNGFYDLIYQPPTNPKNNKAKDNFHIIVRLINPTAKTVKELTFFNTARVIWANFTDGEIRYKGESSFEVNLKKLDCALDDLDIAAIEESEQHQDITYLYQETGMQGHDIMSLSLAYRVSNYLKAYKAISPAVVYSFFKQELPKSLPTYLLPDEPKEWKQWINTLVQKTAVELVLLPKEQLKKVFSTIKYNNLIPIKEVLALSKIKDAFKKARLDFALEQPLIANQIPLKEVLSVTSLSTDEQAMIALTFAEKKNFSPAFIQELEQDKVISPKVAQELNKEHQLATLSNYSLPLIQQLREVLKSPKRKEVNSIRSFAKWSEEQWLEFLKEGKPTKAAKSATRTIDSAFRLQARKMKATAEVLAPDVAVVAAIKRSSQHQLKKINEIEVFIDQQTNLDLKQQHVDTYISDHQLTLDYQTVEEIKVLQRVQRISPDANTAAILMDNQIHNAHQVYQMGLNKMNALFSNTSSSNMGAQVFSAASSQVAMSTGLQTIYSGGFNNTTPQAIINLTTNNPSFSNTIAGIPDLENLFGSSDYCECMHCRSVYSPAAYFTDILNWLSQRAALAPHADAKFALLNRRADLEYIDLNCKNTNTPLPYIDLVCEILEQAISNNPTFVTRNTTWSAEELRAMPEHVQSSVYEMLALIDKSYASYNGFNLLQAETHLYLEQLGISYHQLVATLNKSAPTNGYDKACAYFKISPQEAQAITVSMTDVSQLTTLPNASVGVNVKTFLEDHQLSYEQLIELLQGSFINPTGDIIINRPPKNCALALQELMGLGSNALDRIWRFLRLWKYTNWEIWELDLVLVHPKVGINDLTAANLVSIYEFHQLQHQMNWSVEKGLAFFGDLNTKPRFDVSNNAAPSLYEQVFLNPLLNKDLSSQFAMNPSSNIDTSDSAILAYIATAIGIDSTTAKALINNLGSGLNQLELLSEVYRHAHFIKKLGLTFSEFSELDNLIQISPFTNVQSMVKFLEHHKNLQASTMSVEDVNYLLTSNALQNYLPNTTINPWQDDLNTRLQIAFDELFMDTDSNRVSLERQLPKATNLDNPTDVAKMIDLILDQSWEGSTPVDSNWSSLAADRATFIEEAFDGFATNSEIYFIKLILNQHYPNNPQQGLENRVIVVHFTLHFYINRPIVVDFISEKFGLDNEKASHILELKLPGSTSSLARELSYYNFNPTTTDYIAVYHYINKLNLILTKWDLSLTEIKGYLQHATDLSSLNLLGLPVDGTMPPLTYTSWHNLWNFVRFSKTYGGDNQLFEIIPLAQSGSNADLQNLQGILANWTNWKQADIEAIHNHFAWGTTGSAYLSSNVYQELEAAMAILIPISAPNQDVINWADINNIALLDINNQQVKNALKAVLTPNMWLTTQQSIQDNIRIQKRDALIAYCINYDEAGNEVNRSLNDLFHFYLIDPAMSACQMTSRIKQAISSTQLFIQRCRMSLEKDFVQVDLNDIGWEHWTWMQNYRIWEANRKVFLYPENWIEPELRDDKSEFFEALEDEILQNDITQENVEKAFQNYLLKLNEVANLNITSLCTSYEDGHVVSHVLAQTKEFPSTYYYRKQIGKVWSTWQKIEVDIKGKHATIYVYNNKVHIFWLEILEKPNKLIKLPAVKEKTDGSTQNPEVTKYKEVQLGWTVLQSASWSPKKISELKLIHPWPRPHHSLHLRPRLKNDDLWLDIYVSTSKEFNDTEFYNQFTQEYEELTTQNFSETAKPWHSSSFVFDGFVRKIKLYAVNGYYWFFGKIEEYDTIDIPIKVYKDNEGPLYVRTVEKKNVGGVDKVMLTTNYGIFYNTNSPSSSPSGKNLTNFIDKIISKNINDTNNSYYTGIQPGIFLKRQVFLVINLNGNFVIQLFYNQPFSDRLFSNLQEFNNFLTTGNKLNNSYIYPFSMIPNLVPNHSAPLVSSTGVYGKLTDSHNYIYHNFEEDGRKIEKMTSAEHQPNIDFVHQMHYHNNHLTGNTVFNNILNVRVNSITHMNVHLLLNIAREDKVIIPLEVTKNNYLRPQRLFFQDNERSFYLEKSGSVFNAYPFSHRFPRTFVSLLGSGGSKNLLKRENQFMQYGNYASKYQPDNTFLKFSPNLVGSTDSRTADIVDFSLKGSYSIYNWELFFHIPLLIATQLSKNQRFEEAMQWFHFIFNPTSIDDQPDPNAPSRHFWVTKPFYQHNTADYQNSQIQSLLNNSISGQLEDAINVWQKNPFKPHLVARYRTVAFQKAVVMKYIDNLVAWGDQLFRRETLESINQASLMYIIAYEILGKRPEKVTSVATLDKNYSDLTNLDAFSNSDVAIMVEGLMAWSPTDINNNAGQIPTLNTKYFCIPKNDKLLAYWDLVEDRLFKIRHCMNIDGLIRQLPLFAPPIDPGLLVNAAASGVDLNSVMNNLSLPRTSYKYRALVRLASQFCGEVKSLGQSLLSALQSKDSEGMALLQSSNGLKLLDATITLKELQIEEAKESIASLELSKKSAIYRQDYYTNRVFMNKEEKGSFKLNEKALEMNRTAADMDTLLSVIALIPDFKVGGQGVASSPVADATWGATNLFRSMQAISDGLKRYAGIHSQEGSLLSTMGGYKRRQEEWDLQGELATKEIEQIEKQLIASQIRLAIAEKDLDTHQLQIENAKTEEEYLKSKYTNQQLYSWMVSQISTVYFQAYQLAYDMAKRAEKSFKYELALPKDSSNYIKFGYWDSLKKGLLSGDKLMLSIHKMEAAYVEQNKRELELTKQISLRRLAPTQLLALITTGECMVEIPEWWFDMDFAGHYMRRIKAMSISIPCVVGPYTNINCMVTLEKHTIRKNAIATNGDYIHASNYEESYGAIESVAISHGQNDSGLFELNFNDERYLPFEGAGVISRWKLKLPTKELAQFDYSSITDIVLHMRYTARNGGQNLGALATAELKKKIQLKLNALELKQPAIVLSLKQEFATAWHRFIYPDTPVTDFELSFVLNEKHFPYFTRFANNREIIGARFYVLDKQLDVINYEFTVDIASIQETITVSNNTDMDTVKDTLISSILSDPWKINMLNIQGATPTSMNMENIEDIIVVFDYKLTI